ncbi:MAG: hypothetical protein R3E56_10810 [Burkholderiaceae bacterium]
MLNHHSSESTEADMMSKVLWLAFALVLPVTAEAGSCVKMQGSKWFAESAFVFRGRVIATSLTKNLGLSDVFGPEAVNAQVSPIEVYKGLHHSNMSVFGGTDYQNLVCTRALVAVVEYVFASRPDRAVSRCNTWLADDPDVAEFLKTFRRLKAQSK